MYGFAWMISAVGVVVLGIQRVIGSVTPCVWSQLFVDDSIDCLLVD